MAQKGTVNNFTIYDKKDVFDKQMKPVLDELVSICRNHKIPFFYTACVANDDEHSEYRSDVVSPVGYDVILSDDKISKHIGVTAGFDVVPSRADIEMDVMDDVFDDGFEI